MDNLNKNVNARGPSDGRATLSDASAVASSEAGATPCMTTGGGRAGPEDAGGPALHGRSTGVNPNLGRAANTKPNIPAKPTNNRGRGRMGAAPSSVGRLAPPPLVPSPAANLARVLARTNSREASRPPTPPPLPPLGVTASAAAYKKGTGCKASSPTTTTTTGSASGSAISDLSLSPINWNKVNDGYITAQFDNATLGDTNADDNLDGNKRRHESTGSGASLTASGRSMDNKTPAKRRNDREKSGSLPSTSTGGAAPPPEAAVGTLDELLALNPPTHPPKRSRGSRAANPDIASFSSATLKRLRLSFYLAERKLKHKDFLFVDRALRKKMVERAKRKLRVIPFLRSGISEGVLTLVCKTDDDLDIIEEIARNIQPPDMDSTSRYVIIRGEKSPYFHRLNCKVSDPDIYDDLDSFKLLIYEYNPQLVGKLMIIFGQVNRPNDQDNTVLRLLVDIDFCKEISRTDWKADFGMTKVPFWVPTPTISQEPQTNMEIDLPADPSPPATGADDGDVNVGVLADLLS